MAGEDTKKKAAVAGLASILLVAAVVAVAVGSSKSGSEASEESGGGGGGGGGGDISSSTKAVEAICAPTSYKQTCEDSLAGSNTTDSKQLVEIAMNATINKVAGVLTNSTLLKEAASDPMTKAAYEVCEDVLDRAIIDLRRSVEHFGAFDISKADDLVNDIRTWLSAVIANKDTCIDAFQNTTGDTAEKMKKMLEKASQMASNALAMVTDLSAILGQFNLDSLGLGSRRLLDEYENFVDRRQLEEKVFSIPPKMVVAQDGSGQFKTITEAIKKLAANITPTGPGQPPRNTTTWTVIKIKAGVYKEYIEIPFGLNKVVFLGDGPNATKITGSKSVGGGVQTYFTATVTIVAEDFMAKDIGFENTAGPQGFQALAIRVSGDRAVFLNARFDGYQDTVCADNYRQFYRDCTFTGTIDFLFGISLALFQNCTFLIRKPGPSQDCAVMAHGRNDANSNSGFVLQNCKIVAEPALTAVVPRVKTYLARPWKEMARSIIISTEIDGIIDPIGYAPCMKGLGEKGCHFGEFNNKGPGAPTDKRVKWPCIKKMTADVAQKWTGPTMFVDDAWVSQSGAAYDKVPK